MDIVLDLDPATTWFASDHHFGHANIIGYCERPFADVDEMAEQLMARHNAVVGTDDTVLLLGDFSMSPSWLWCAGNLAGQLIFLRGNHDAIWPAHKGNSPSMLRRYQGAFDVVLEGLSVPIALDGRPALISHLPYVEDERHGERHAALRPVDEGLPLICGHVHQSWRTQGRQYNVGVDCSDFAPTRGTELVAWIDQL